MFCRGFGYGFRGFGMSWGWAGWLGMFLQVAFIVGLIYLVFRFIRGLAESTGHKNTALYVLEEEYAKGMISREEFIEKRQVLKDK